MKYQIELGSCRRQYQWLLWRAYSMCWAHSTASLIKNNGILYPPAKDSYVPSTSKACCKKNSYTLPMTAFADSHGNFHEIIEGGSVNRTSGGIDSVWITSES